MSLKNVSRRNFVAVGGKAVVFAGGLVAAGLTIEQAFAEGKTADKKAGDKKDSKGGADDLALIDEKSAMATTLKYYADGSKAPAAVKVAKAGLDGSKQNCANCMFYVKAGKNKGEEVGKCQLFPQGHAPAKAWCASWTLKAK